jgi:hypothetical protein
MGKLGRNKATAPAVAVMTVLLSSAAHAELQGTAQLGAGYSDNIARTDVDETNETIGTLGLQLNWTERTRRITGDADIDLSYFEYLDNTFESEVVGTGNGSLAFAIVPDRLQWVFEDSFGQAQSDPFAPATPETREDLNYFSTGPDLTLHFGSTVFSRLFGRWSKTTYETSPLDAERRTAGLGVGRRASSRSEFSLNGVTEKVDFDSELNPDYDRKSAFVNYSLDAARTRLSTDLGYTWLDRDGAADTSGSALMNITATRELSAASSLQLTLSSQLGDAGDSLRGGLSSSVVGIGGQITATSDPFENRVVSLEYRFSRTRTGFSLGISRTDDQYETQSQLDRKATVYNAAFSRRLARTLDLELTAALFDENFDSSDLESDELRYGVALNWRAFRTIGWRLLVERYDRDTNNGTGEYTENRAFLTMGYYWGGGDAPAIR